MKAVIFLLVVAAFSVSAHTATRRALAAFRNGASALDPDTPAASAPAAPSTGASGVCCCCSADGKAIDKRYVCGSDEATAAEKVCLKNEAGKPPKRWETAGPEGCRVHCAKIAAGAKAAPATPQQSSAAKQCVFVPGAFRPPHKGHFAMVAQAAAKHPGYTIYVVVTAHANHTRHGITADDSKNIWEKFYIPLLKSQNVDVELLTTPSYDPHRAAWALGLKDPCKCSETNKCFVIAGPDRANFAQALDGAFVNKYVYDSFAERIGGDVSATKFCGDIFAKKNALTAEAKNTIGTTYLPEALSADKKSELIDFLAGKCNGQ